MSASTAVSTAASLTPTEIAIRRKSLGISQRELAELICSGRVTISRWERGVEPFPDERKAQIGAALNVIEASFAVAREVAGRAGPR